MKLKSCKKIKPRYLVFSLLIIIFFLTYRYFTYCSPRNHGLFPASTTIAEEINIENDFNFAPPDEGYCIYVNLDVKLLCLYQDGELYKAWPISGGTKATPSPTGEWIVNGVSNWGEGFGGSWISISVPWGKYGIHGTKEPWATGNSNISHGCIRMNNADVAELKKYVAYGTPVFIEYVGIPFRKLEDGKIGSDVYELQQMLKKLGYYSGTPDGKYGKSTYNAVIAFQKAEGLNADGIVGKGTWDTLQFAIE